MAAAVPSAIAAVTLDAMPDHQDALLPRMDPLTAKAARHSDMKRQALFFACGSVVVGFFVASDVEYFTTGWVRGVLSWLVWVPLISSLLFFIWSHMAHRLATGYLEDLDMTARERITQRATMPAATLLWMASRRRAWGHLRKAVLWLAGEICLAGVFVALGRWSRDLVIAACLPIALLPFTLLAVIMRAAEFLIVSQWRWHERQALAAAKSAHYSPEL